MHKNLCFFLLLLCSSKVFSQQRDLLSSSYTLVPGKTNGIDFNLSEIQLSIPLKTSLGFISSSISAKHYRFFYQQNISYLSESLENFYQINYNVNYFTPLSDKWRIGINFNILTQSNFEQKISNEDLNFGGGLVFTKATTNKNNTSQLTFGLGYNNALGEARLLPIIGYTKQYLNGSSFSIGFPNTYYNYLVNERTSIKALININSFYANVSDRPRFDSENLIEKAFFISGALGLEIRRSIEKNWTVFARTSYSFLNEYQLLNMQENEIYNFNLSPFVTITTGVTFNLNKR